MNFVWNQSLMPDVSGYRSVALWRYFSDAPSLSLGGVVTRFLDESVPSLVCVVMSDGVLAVEIDEVDRVSAMGVFALGADASYPFSPGDGSSGRYELTFPGAVISRSVLVGGVAFPGGVVESVLLPSNPTYTASMAVNRLSELGALSAGGWVVVLDQYSGDVSLHLYPPGDEFSLATFLSSSGVSLAASVIPA